MRSASGFQRRNEPGRGRLWVCNNGEIRSRLWAMSCQCLVRCWAHTCSMWSEYGLYLGMATIFIQSPMSNRLITPLIQNPRDNVICLSPKNRIFVVPSWTAIKQCVCCSIWWIYTDRWDRQGVEVARAMARHSDVWGGKSWEGGGVIGGATLEAGIHT